MQGKNLLLFGFPESGVQGKQPLLKLKGPQRDRQNTENLWIRYWRDKAGREVDFVLARRRDQIDKLGELTVKICYPSGIISC